MLLSVSLIIILGLCGAYLAEKIKLPKIIGMLIAGIIIGPYGLNYISGDFLFFSGDIRKMALAIILIKAGLTLNVRDLKKVGLSAVLMSFVPAVCEIFGYIIFAPMLLGITHAEAFILGSIMSAVSPAVVVPRMVDLIDKGIGVKKAIPQMILAGASCDDIVVIVLFNSAIQMALAKSVSVTGQITHIVLTIGMGLVVGVLFSKVLIKLFKQEFKQPAYRVFILLASAFLLLVLEDQLSNVFVFSALIAIVGLSLLLKKALNKEIVAFFLRYVSQLWLIAELFLFFLLGCTVNINALQHIGLMAFVLILICIVFRSVGLYVSVLKTPLNAKEKMFCCIAYLPKATVQAAIGGVPLSLGLPNGMLFLSVAVLGIVFTAPLGAFLIDYFAEKLLLNDK